MGQLIYFANHTLKQYFCPICKWSEIYGNPCVMENIIETFYERWNNCQIEIIPEYSERMESIKAYKINDLLELRLETNGATNIYIDGKYFRVCKYLLIDIPLNNIAQYDDYHSINEIIDNSMTGHSNSGLTPEQAFQGHCSNLQAWVENNYNTDILDVKLSFPLLKALMKCGDKKAIIQYKEEVIHKILSGSLNTLKYLTFTRCLTPFSKEELKMLEREIRQTEIKGKQIEGIKHILKYIRNRYYYLEAKRRKKILESAGISTKIRKRRISELKLKMIEIGFDRFQLKITMFL